MRVRTGWLGGCVGLVTLLLGGLVLAQTPPGSGGGVAVIRHPVCSGACQQRLDQSEFVDGVTKCAQCRVYGPFYAKLCGPCATQSSQCAVCQAPLPAFPASAGGNPLRGGLAASGSPGLAGSLSTLAGVDVKDQVIRALRQLHCKRGPARCERCRTSTAVTIMLLDIAPPNAGMVQRPVIEVRRDGKKQWCEYDVLRSFADEAEARAYAAAHGIVDAQYTAGGSE